MQLGAPCCGVDVGWAGCITCHRLLSLAVCPEISAHSHSGTSGMTSRIGLGVSSATRFKTPTVFAARNGGRPLHSDPEGPARASGTC
jgi:hypothetical protein